MKKLIIAAVAIAVIVGLRIVWKTVICADGRCGSAIGAYDDRMGELGKTDPKLIGYRESGRIPTGLKKPRAIALDKAGWIYVAGDYAIRVFWADGKHESDIRTGAEPQGVAVSEDGTIYAAMRNHVEVFDKGGARVAVWGAAGKRAYFTSIAVADKSIWVADAGNRVVYRYDPAGQVTAVIAAKDPAKKAPGLVVPSPYLDLVPAPGGAIWVNNPGRHKLELYDSEGRLERSWGKTSFAVDGFSGCCNPTNFAILPDGRFVTSEKGIPRVKVYGPDGKLLWVVAGRELFAPEAAGLDVETDPSGRILVLDPANRSIRIFVEKDGLQ